MTTKAPLPHRQSFACPRFPPTAALVFLFTLSSSAALCGPQPGEVYREYAVHQAGDDWRVTNPAVAGERARRHLPNPVLHVTIGDLAGAVRAEAMLDRWGGHVSTKRPQLRFNGRDWLDVPPPLVPPGNGDHERYYFQDNPVIDVPLAHLQAGVNTFEGTTSHENPTAWGQWGLYSLILRVYYDSTELPHAEARIVSPAPGATFSENPIVRVEATAPNGVARVDVLAWYEGYDENGDGVWLDWHQHYFQPLRGHAAELREHVGTAWRSPYDIRWDTRWVPDQQPRAVKLVARVQDSRGAWTVTEPVSDLTLQRKGESVRLYRTAEVPLRFGVRNKLAKSCAIPIPANARLAAAVEAGLHLRTWHGWDGHHHPYKLNEVVQPVGGKNHHYAYDIHVIAPSALHTGDNTFAISSDTEHHMLEVHWPGPALTVRYRETARR